MFLRKMASSSAIPIARVAIPATYWADKFIQNEKWFPYKDKMFYEGTVESSYYNNKAKTTNYKIRLLQTDDIVWLKDDEVEKYDFSKMPSNGELVVKSDSTESDEDTDDDVILTSKKAASRKRRKLKSTLSKG